MPEYPLLILAVIPSALRDSVILFREAVIVHGGIDVLFELLSLADKAFQIIPDKLHALFKQFPNLFLVISLYAEIDQSERHGNYGKVQNKHIQRILPVKHTVLDAVIVQTD